MKDYPSFREDWLALVTPELEDHEHRIQICNKVPEQDWRNLSNMSSMEEIWAYLDNKYCKKDVLTADRITDLHIFWASKAAQTDSAKFAEYYQVW